jgi:Kef-type K+ transport system membrane component KefB
MFVTLLIVLLSAFVTDIIGKEIAVFVYWQYSNNITIDRAIFFFYWNCSGIHAIFGGFLAGVIVPHDQDLAIKITEKIEDIVNIVFLPLVKINQCLYLHVTLTDSNDF